jgi:peroxiredoxin
MKHFVEEHLGKFVTLQAIAMLNPDTDLNLFKKTSELLSEKYLNNPFVMNFSSSVASLTKLAPGTIAPNFTISTPDDKPISLNDFKGKYVLIDFWASWCRPCRAQNPELVALYKKFKGKNFEIFGISLDQNKDAWVQAIAADKLTWPQGSDLQYWNSAPAKLYNITFIPFNYLIGPDGTILAKNLTGKDLENKLQELLNSKPL